VGQRRVSLETLSPLPAQCSTLVIKLAQEPARALSPTGCCLTSQTLCLMSGLEGGTALESAS
jgi:hypothetical protein